MYLSLSHHFDAAHRLENHEGACRNIHGHRWEVLVEISGVVPSSGTGMIVDFKEIKDIINRYDHCLILNGENQFNKELIDFFHSSIEHINVMMLDFTPTAENIAKDIKRAIWRIIFNCKINDNQIKVTVWESPGAKVTT